MRIINIYVCLLFILLLSFATNIYGQTAKRQISGVVVDNLQSPIIGATIMIDGTTKGTITGVDGDFSIEAERGNVLSITFLGYKKKKLTIGEANSYNIILEEDAISMDEVVVIGYATAKRSDLTGSVASVKSEEIMKTGTATFSEALQGRVAGVKVVTQSGEPGAGVDITIRGSNSLNAGTSPLYIIDGMQIDVNEGEVASSSVGGQTSYNPLASINPNDIASIDVLKDASSTAIYGARGANGVIIITTKSGASSKTDINLNVSYSVARIAKKYDMLDGQSYIDYKFARGASDMDIWGKDYGDGKGLVPRNVVKDELSTYNWQDEMTQTAFTQNYDLSMNTVMNRNTRISTSLGYYDEKGVIVSNGFKRYSGRIKVDHQINKKIDVGLSTTLGRVDNSGAISSGGTSGTGGYTGVIQLMYTERPVALYTPSELAGEFSDGYIPLSSMTTSETYKRAVTDRILANTYIRYKPMNGMSLRLSGSLSSTNSKLSEFYSSKSRWGRSSDGRSTIDNVSTLGYTLTATGDYNKLINKTHRINGLLGAEINSYSPERMFIRVDNYEDQSTGVFDIGKGQTVNNYSSNVTKVNRASLFGRVNYDYKSRYYLTANMRVDASSNFAKSARVGYFPSVALAWRVSNEKFMSKANEKGIENLKIRTSAGITGNDRISPYSYLSVMGTSYYANNGGILFGQAISSPNNSQLKWETTYQYDLGMDIDLFSSRISLTTDIYLKDTRDMLYNANIASQSGFPRIWKNLGRMTNQGFEISIKTRNIVSKNFNWTTSINFDTNKTKLISLGGEEHFFPVSLNYGAFTDVGRVIVGEPIGLIYGYVWDGNYQINDFVWTDKRTGTQVAAESINSNNMSQYNHHLRDDVVSFKGTTVSPGDRKYKDLTGDNTIDPNDRDIIGDTNPKFNFGIGNDFTFGNFDLSLFIDGSYGGKILNAFRRMIEPGLNNNTNNLLSESWENRWTPENGSNSYPRLLNTLDQQVSSYFVEDGSFLRIKNINLGYTFDKKFFRNMGISNIRVYGLVNNVYTFTKYSGLDPEVRSYEKFLRGMDQTAYPRTRSFMFGFNATF